MTLSLIMCYLLYQLKDIIMLFKSISHTSTCSVLPLRLYWFLWLAEVDSDYVGQTELRDLPTVA